MGDPNALKIRVSLKEVFRDDFPENGKISRKIDFICVLGNPKLILWYSNKYFRGKNILEINCFPIKVSMYNFNNSVRLCIFLNIMMISRTKNVVLNSRLLYN